MRRGLIISVVAIVAAAGCGKSEQEKQAEQTKKAAEQIAQGAQQAAAGAQQAAQGAQQGSQQVAQGLEAFAKGLAQMGQSQGPSIDFEVLKGLLPEIPGWTRSSPRGEQTTMPFKISKASARYQKDESTINIEILDSSLNQLILAPFTMFMTMGFEERSDDGFKRATKIGGSPAFEEWKTQSKDGEISVVVGNRFIVSVKGDNIENIEVVRKAVQAVDLNKLAGTK